MATEESARKAVECGAVLVTCNNPKPALDLYKRQGFNKGKMRIYKNKEQELLFKQINRENTLIVCDVNTRKFIPSALRGCPVHLFEEKHLIPEISKLQPLLAKAERFEYILGVGRAR